MSTKSLLFVVLTTLPVVPSAAPPGGGFLQTTPFRADFLPTTLFSAGYPPKTLSRAGFPLTVLFSTVDPVGAYCMLDQVVLDPDDVAPTRIQMWGAFAAADASATSGYARVSRGYMYYTCPPGHSAACRSEWADLRWISGTGKAIGYGLREKPMGRLRRQDEAVASPDPYPLDGGLVKVESKDPTFTDLVAQLKAALAGRTYLMARTFVASMTYMPRP